MTMKINRLRKVVLHSKAGIKLLKVAMQKRLDPYRFSWLEQAAQKKIYWVSPKDIHFVSRGKISIAEIGKVLDGDWDGLSLPFEQSDFYQALVSVFRNGRTWSETPFFQRTLSKIKLGHVEWECHTEEQFRVRLQTVEDLYQETDKLGYIPSRYQAPAISVNIGRHGDLLLNGGESWLGLAKLLKLSRIPIIIVARHHQWVEFKRKVKEYALQRRGVYAPLLHPDLAWVPAHHGHDRFELIRNALINQSGTMLDIGCHWGYFCQQFEAVGFDCVGIEVRPTNFYFLEKLKRASNKKFQIVNDTIFDYMHHQPRQYDVVLALAIFHQLLKAESHFHQLKELLAKFHAREMYFQPHNPWESQMRNAYWNPSPGEFVEFILKHSELNRAICIGNTKSGRPLYQLTI